MTGTGIGRRGFVALSAGAAAGAVVSPGMQPATALQNAGVSWKVYQNANDNYGDNGLAYFTQFTSVAAGTPLHDRGMASVPNTTGSTPDDIVAAIKADVLAGTLPQAPGSCPTRQRGEGACQASRRRRETRNRP
jgi:phospholipase C